MEVLGTLAKLDRENSLPLPWWHRAPLGLLNNTYVYLALVESEHRPVGDFIVTVLDPMQWDNMLKIECYGPDKPGFISKVFGSILPLNIAIAETVTLETGATHHVTLISEPYGSGKLTEQEVKTNLENSNIPKYKISQFFNHHPIVKWHQIVPIDHGWIKNINWKEIIKTNYAAAKINQVDLERVVVSADTTKRLIRYVFPKKGVIKIEIEHADTPGVMKEITDILADCNSNILSLLLRRGGATPKNAILIAVCEPIDNLPPAEFKANVENALSKLDQRFRPGFKPPNYGIVASKMIYPRHPDEFVTKVPDKLILEIKIYQEQIPHNKIPIFISRRFIEDERIDKIVNYVKKILTDNNCFPVEATREPGEYQAPLNQIISKMWLCKAGIVLVAGAKKEDGFNVNLAHEAGFLQGQGKPYLLLAEEGSDKNSGFANWSGKDLVTPRFPGDGKAFDETHPRSIKTIIQKWLNTMK